MQLVHFNIHTIHSRCQIAVKTKDNLREVIRLQKSNLYLHSRRKNVEGKKCGGNHKTILDKLKQCEPSVLSVCPAAQKPKSSKI